MVNHDQEHASFLESASSSSSSNNRNRNMKEEGTRGAAIVFMMGAAVVTAFVLFSNGFTLEDTSVSPMALKKSQTSNKPNIILRVYTR